MIRFTVRCAEGHDFDSWFADGAAFDRLRAAAQVACPDCGSTKVAKALMAPAVRPARKSAGREGAGGGAPLPVATPHAPDPELAAAIARLRRHVETSSDDVGDRFATEARAMHLGDVPLRAIHGQASREEARDLVEDGVPILPLPFDPGRKAN